MSSSADRHWFPHATRPLVVPILLLALVLIAFGRSLWQGFAPVDDSYLIVHNLAVQGPTAGNLKTVFTTYDPELYIPLTLASFQVNYLISGLEPWSYHLGNILLHAANAMLVVLVLFQISKNRLAAMIAGLVFAVHPLNAEAVVWITGRKDLLATLFALLSFLAYIRYRQHTRFAYALAVACFALSLFSKISAVTLPAVFLLCDVLLEQRSDWRRIITEKIPFALLSLLFLGIALWGKERVVGDTGVLEIFLMAGRSTLFYLQKFFLPFGFSVFYPYTDPITLARPDLLIALVALLALLGSLVWFWKRRPVAVFAVAFFLVMVAPSLPHFRKAGIVYFAVDRYAYLASAGLCLLLALLLSFALERWSRRAVLGTSAVVLGVLTLLSVYQTSVWDSASSLLGHALRLYPNSVEARVNIARILRAEKKYQEAFDLLRDGLQYGDDVQLHLQAGSLFAETNNIDKALQEFNTAATMAPLDPNPPFALATLARQLGDTDEAMRQYERTIALDASFVTAHVHLARLIRENRKDISGAEEHLQTALRWSPSSVDAHMEYARLLLERNGSGDREVAITHLRSALQVDPENVDALQMLAEASANAVR